MLDNSALQCAKYVYATTTYTVLVLCGVTVSYITYGTDSVRTVLPTCCRNTVPLSASVTAAVYRSHSYHHHPLT